MKKSTRRTYYRNDNFLIEIGQRNREFRLKKGLTQTELAFLCNDIDYSQINRVELGKVNFSISFLYLVAKALEINPIDLISDENELQKSKTRFP